MSSTGVDRSTSMAGNLDAFGWGVFLIWVGTALFADLGWAVFFLGMGLIMLGGQWARRHFELRVDWFALLLGSCFVAVGGWQALGLRFDGAAVPAWFIPALFVAAGLAVVVAAWKRRPQA